MQNEVKSKLVALPVKIVGVIVALMILTRFSFVLYDFIRNPFHEPATMSPAALHHVMTGLILLELFALTIRFVVKEIIDPNLIIVTVLTAVGRDLIAMNIMEIDYLKILALGFIFHLSYLS
jgi:uncharacterized membrane protein (DUF373 family)